MTQTIASWFPVAIIALLAWLVPKYVARRVGEAARGAVDISVGKALADHKFGVDKQLESYRSDLALGMENLRQTLAFDRERYSQDYGLFASRRNEIYADTFSLLQKAHGGFASTFAKLLSYRDFSESSVPDLRHLADRLELVSANERACLKEAIDAGSTDLARKLANQLNERDELRRANRWFYDFRNACTLNALYFSPDVDVLLSQAIRPLAVLSTIADEIIAEEGVNRRDAYPLVEQLDDLTARIRHTMRDEMQAGFKGEPAQ